LSPAHGTIFSADTVRLSWNRVLPKSTKYWLDVATDSLFTFRSSDSTITDTSHVAGNLAHSQTYWWRARGYDNGWGPFSAAWKFSIQVGVGVEENNADIPKVFSLEQNYPNPFNPRTGIRYSVPGVSDVKLTVFDILGREVAVLVNERKPAGRYEVNFDASGLASGMYVYRLTAGRSVGSKTMLLVK
jgi:hypothetical protein